MSDAFSLPRRRSPLRLKAPVVLEHPLQRQIADALAKEIAPPGKLSREGVVWWAVDHANYAGEVPAARIGRGIIPGLADLFFLYRGRAHFCELKIDAPHSRMSDAQCEVASAVLGAGGRVGVALSLEQVLGCLDNWHLPRARRIGL